MQLGTGITRVLFFPVFFPKLLESCYIVFVIKRETRISHAQKQKGSGFQPLRSAELVKAEETGVSPTPLPPGQLLNCPQPKPSLD